MKLVILKNNWMKMQTDIDAKKKKNDDEKIKYTMIDLSPKGVALRTKQFLEGIQEGSLSGRMLLIQHTNAILERLHTDVRNLRRSNTIDSLHPNVHFETNKNNTSKSIKWIRDHMEICIKRKQKVRRTRGG